MRTFGRILDSTVGQKVIAGVTGLALLGFLFVHMAGNLQIFAGAEKLNAYAEFLKSEKLILWLARLGLLGLITMHIAMTIRQRVRNRKLRARRYVQTSFQRTTPSSRWMMVSGTVLLAFVVFHLLHFTVGAVLPNAYSQTDHQGRHDVYAMVIDSFRNPLIVLIYVAGMLALATHLQHAISSAWQTLGIVREGSNSQLRKLSPFLAATIIVGFLSVPLSVALGLVGG